jgi:uncharacterized phiE125 gp8 family phage protein
MVAFEAAVSNEPISLAEAKAHLRVYLPDEDDYIAGLITAARQMAEGRLNRTLVQRSRTVTFDAMDARYVLRKPPVVSVDNVVVSGVDGAIDSTLYVLRDYGEDSPPVLSAAYGSTWAAAIPRGAVLTVEYTAGYPDGEVPRPIIQWMLLAIGTMYENRETESAGVQIYSLSEDFMRWLLQPYMVYE